MRTPFAITIAAAALLAACGQPAATTAEAPAVEAAATEVAAAEAPAAPALDPKTSRVFVNAEGVAVSGYDPVAFFDGAPAQGDPAITSTVDGATYRFVSAENKAKFDAEPAKYQPQYGGYCAYGAAVGGKYPTDPSTAKVVDGKLYLNKNPDVAKQWAKKQPELIEKANAQWPEIIDSEVKG